MKLRISRKEQKRIKNKREVFGLKCWETIQVFDKEADAL